MVTTLRISCSLWQLLIVGITVLLLQAEAKSLDVTQMSVSQIEDAVQVSHYLGVCPVNSLSITFMLGLKVELIDFSNAQL